jgi:hypothetical protein
MGAGERNGRDGRVEEGRGRGGRGGERRAGREGWKVRLPNIQSRSTPLAFQLFPQFKMVIEKYSI